MSETFDPDWLAHLQRQPGPCRQKGSYWFCPRLSHKPWLIPAGLALVGGEEGREVLGQEPRKEEERGSGQRGAEKKLGKGGQ